MNHIFAYLLTLAAVLFAPVLTLCAAIGLIIGIVVRRTITLFQTSRKFRRGVRRVAQAALVAGLVALSFFIYSRLQPRYSIFVTSPIFELPYTAVAELPTGAQAWDVNEQILLLPDVLQDVRSSNLLRGTPEEKEQRFRDLLVSNRWVPAGETNSIETWRRVRPVPMSARWIPATTSVTVPIDIGERIYDILLLPDEESTFSFRTQKHLIVSSFPPIADTAALPGTNQLNLTVPAMYPNVQAYPGFEANITLEVLSPLLRWRIADVIVGLSLWDGFKWLALLACGVFSDEIKDRFIQPLVGRLFTWPTFGKSRKTESAEDP